MKGVGWEVSESLDVQQARKAGELISEVGKALANPTEVISVYIDNTSAQESRCCVSWRVIYWFTGEVRQLLLMVQLL